MFKLRIIPKDLDKHEIREVLHADRRIAMHAAEDYSGFSDVQEVEVINTDTGEILEVFSENEPDLSLDFYDVEENMYEEL